MFGHLSRFLNGMTTQMVFVAFIFSKAVTFIYQIMEKK